MIPVFYKPLKNVPGTVNVRVLLFCVGLLVAGITNAQCISTTPVPNRCSEPCGDQIDCLCRCLLDKAQKLRWEEKFDEAILNLRPIVSLCPEWKAQDIIDSIYQENRIWIYRDGAYAIATPLAAPNNQ